MDAHAIFLFHRNRDDDGLDGVFAKIEDVVLASQGLSEVTATIQGLSDLVKETNNISADCGAVKKC